MPEQPIRKPLWPCLCRRRYRREHILFHTANIRNPYFSDTLVRANALRKRVENIRKFIIRHLFADILIQGEELFYRNQRVAAARHNISLKRMHCSSLRWKEYLQLEIFGFQSFLSVCFRSVSIVVKKAFDLGERPASQSKRFCRTNVDLSD